MSENYFILTFVDDELKLLIRSLYLLILDSDDDGLIESCSTLIDRFQSKLGGN